MKIKKNAEAVSSSDFWYDLFYGDYFKPEKFLEDANDVLRVREACKIISEYEQALLDAKKLEVM